MAKRHNRDAPAPAAQDDAANAAETRALAEEALARHDAQEDEAAREDAAYARLPPGTPLLAPVLADIQDLAQAQAAAEASARPAEPRPPEQLPYSEAARLRADYYFGLWNVLVAVAFDADLDDDWGEAATVMADFALANPDAPDGALLIEVRRKCRVALLPNEDPRRLLLAVKLFRLAVTGLAAIDAEDLAAAAEPAAELPRRPPSPDGPFAPVKDRFAPSALGQALLRQGDA